MFRKPLFFGLVLMVVFALMQLNSAAAKSPWLPFQAKATSTIVMEVSKAVPVGIEDGWVILEVPWHTLKESGEATHLGMYSVDKSGLITIAVNLLDGSQTWLKIEGLAVFTAANRDTINSAVLQVDGNASTVTFQGGTGRFKNAEGSAIETLTVTSTTTNEVGDRVLTGTLELQGQIRY